MRAVRWCFLGLCACAGELEPEPEQMAPTPPVEFLPVATGSCPGFADGEGCFADPFGLTCTFSPDGVAPRPVRLWLDPERESYESLTFYWHGLGASTWDGASHMPVAWIVDAGGILAAPEKSGDLDIPFGDPWFTEVDQTGPSDDFVVMDEVVACAIEHLGLNPRRIHSVGVSSGGAQTTQVGRRRSGYVASVVVFSGYLIGEPE
ncbi:MAG: hypothetical protein JRI25_19510, partial [Deltaproteobacteria bacterium]|nr:hypothetical protein [Deltaproteobacteria bacterium]